MSKCLKNEEEEKEESKKLEFHYWKHLIPELKRICISSLNITDLASLDTAYANRKEISSLFYFLKSHITNSYEFKSIESLLWATKKLPKLNFPKLLLSESVRKRLITWHFVCQTKGLEHVARILLPSIAHSSNINQQDTSEMTCLHYAAREGLIDNVKLLVANGAAINIRDVYGRTPVFLACLREHDEVFDFLVHANADLSLASFGGQSVADLLEERAGAGAAHPPHWAEQFFLSILAAAFFFFYYKRWWELIRELFRA